LASPPHLRRHQFLVLLPRAPRPTLFPYMTLFRSVHLDDIHHLQQRREFALVSAEVIQRERVSRGFERAAALDQSAVHLHRLQNLDRKSTRLNSSHDQISYAVFCLKKKSDK